MTAEHDFTMPLDGDDYVEVDQYENATVVAVYCDPDDLTAKLKGLIRAVALVEAASRPTLH